MNTFKIKRGDATLEVEMTDDLKKTMSRILLIDESDITEKHVCKFIHDALANAIAKDERERDGCNT